MTVHRWVDAFKRRHKIDDLPDDPTIEHRYTWVRWVPDAALRAAQRRCFLLAEWYAAHPEAGAAIAADEAARASRYRRAPPAAAPSRPASTEPAAAVDDGWAGIESTMPVHVRRRAINE